jgi:hypothetical protein
MSQLHVNQIRRFLEETFREHVDLADLNGRPKEEVEVAMLSRALAAAAVCARAGVEPEVACRSITDGYDDQGIDALYFDRPANTLWVVQAKWSRSGSGGIKQGDITKLISGFRQVVGGELDRFNHKIRERRAEIDEAISIPGQRCELIVIHNSTEGLSKHITGDLNSLIEEMNDTSEMVNWSSMGQTEVYRIAVDGRGEGPVDIEVDMNDWGMVEGPYQAFYGTVDTGQVGHWWTQFGRKLFTKNIRMFKDSSSVNTQISTTLEQEGAHFWYFNNGITFLCEDIEEPLRNRRSRRHGRFHCRGASVVNGAQTVGAIGRSSQRLFVDSPAGEVLVRLISLKQCPAGFGNQVTRATNTQNHVHPRDFAALDTEQERIGMELRADGIQYAFRSGDTVGDTSAGLNIEEAAIALCCSHRDLKYTVVAKSNIGAVWRTSDEGGYYHDVFQKGIEGKRIWDNVKVMRQVDTALGTVTAETTGLLHGITVHGNRFVLRQVFKLVRSQRRPMSPARLSAVVRGIVGAIESSIQGSPFARSLPWSFKNRTRLTDLESAISGVIPKLLDRSADQERPSVDVQAHPATPEAQLTLKFDDE